MRRILLTVLLAATLSAGCIASLKPAAQCADETAMTGCATVSVRLVGLSVGGVALPTAGYNATFALSAPPSLLGPAVAHALHGHRVGDLVTADAHVQVVPNPIVTPLVRDVNASLFRRGAPAVGEQIQDASGNTYDVVGHTETANHTVTSVQLKQVVQAQNLTEVPQVGVATYTVVNDTAEVRYFIPHNGTLATSGGSEIFVLGTNHKSLMLLLTAPLGVGEFATANATFEITRIIPGEAPFPTNGAYGAVPGPTPTPMAAPESSGPSATIIAPAPPPK